MRYAKKFGWIAVLLLLVGGFFYQTFTRQKLPVPSDTLVGLYHPWRDLYAATYPRGVPFKNFLITDPIRQQIPWRKIVTDAWKRGERPGWNPFAFAGASLDANIQAAPYYPLNILFLLLDFPLAWTFLIILQPLLAGVFLYLYLRNVKLSVAASFLGATAWAFGGFSIAWLTWGTMMQTALWLPLILLAIDSRRRALLGLSVFMTIVAGHAQIALYILGLAGAYLLWRKTKGWVLAPIGIAVVVAAIQWIPLLRFLLESGRVDATESWKNLGWFLPWQHLAQFIAPDFFGNPATLNYWGVWNYGEFVGFIGLIPIALALGVFTLAGLPRFFVAAIGLSLFLMLPHPLSTLPFRLHLPVVSVLQPTRLMVIVDFSLAVLAALSFDRLLKGQKHSITASAVYVGIVLGILWAITLGAPFVTQDASMLGNLAVAKRNLIFPTAMFGGFVVWFIIFGRMRHARLKYLGVSILFAAVVFDLFRFGWKFTPFTPKEYFFPTTSVITFFRNQRQPFRVMSLDDRILPPNVSAYYGIETIEGYDPIASSRYEDFLVASERGKADVSRPTGFNRIYTLHNVDSPLLPYMNVRYVLTLSDITRPFLRNVYEEGETRVYEYTKALPRAYLADKVVIAPNTTEALQALFDNQSARLGVYAGNPPIMDIGLMGDEGVDVTYYHENEIGMSVKAANPRLLVILNRFDERWKATLDGKASDVFPVNYLFTGMVVPPGTHNVILSYY